MDVIIYDCVQIEDEWWTDLRVDRSKRQIETKARGARKHPWRRVQCAANRQAAEVLPFFLAIIVSLSLFHCE